MVESYGVKTLLSSVSEYNVWFQHLSALETNKIRPNNASGPLMAPFYVLMTFYMTI